MIFKLGWQATSITALLTLPTSVAHAYIGPGAGLGAILTLTGVVLGVILLAFGFLWYPLKRLLNKRGKNKSPSEASKSKGGES